jgi:hypothetical protein
MPGMSKSRRLGLDELMIVNPGRSDGAGYLLGDDNTLYRVEGLAQNDPPSRFFLGEDGTLYEVMGPDRASGVRRNVR